MSHRRSYSLLAQEESYLEAESNHQIESREEDDTTRGVHEKSKDVIGKENTTHWTQRKRGIAVVAAILLTIALLVQGTRSSRGHLSSSSATEADTTLPRPRYLRLLVPGSHADADLCKSVLSSAVLGYPSPTLINWNKHYDNSDLGLSSSRIAKISGVLAHLNSLDRSHDDDIVIVADGHNVIFQLRPSVLLHRYNDINRRANDRIRGQLGAAMDYQNITQKVIFSAQKRCWPKEASHPACYAVPESTLPLDAYGKETDKDVGDKAHPFVKHRQRYLNSGSCIGPVSAVRALFKRAKEKIGADQNLGSDQDAFAEIFGEQEFYRLIMKTQHRSRMRKVIDWWSKKLGMSYSWELIDSENSGGRQILPYYEDVNFEFGIGLDYQSEIQHATVFAEDDSEWVYHDNQAEIASISQAKGISSPSRSSSLSEDIRSSLQPFYSIRRGSLPGGQLPTDKTWETVPLLTNKWTGISPVAVQYNPDHDSLGPHISTQWNRTWYQPYMRALLDERVLMPQHVVAVTEDDGREQAWWSPTSSSYENEWGGIHTDTWGDWMDFEKLCAGEGIWDEVMLDGRGNWYDPRYREPRPFIEETSAPAN